MMMQTPREETFTFPCGDGGDALVAILHDPGLAAERAVIVVVGGPQYRTGAHRQYVMLARALAEAGVPVLRFDYRGMGDSDGAFRGFEDCGADISAAMDALCARLPAVREVVLWGLCDGATAIAFHHSARRDPRVAGVVILNPWARSPETLAEARVRHWYGRRIASPEFWKKLLRGGVDLRGAVTGVAGSVAARLRRRRAAAGGAGVPAAPLPDRLAAALEATTVPVCLILSGRDLTAREFEEAVLTRPAVRRALGGGRLTLHRLPEANHTYSSPAWREQVHTWTLDWLRGLGRSA